MVGVYIALEVAALLCAHRWGWPEAFVIPAVAVPYWWVATAVWSQWGPEVPGLP